MTGEGQESVESANAVVINENLSVPFAELRFRATRAGGPGGQHVNTSATRVELSFDVGASPSLSDAQRARIRERLARRIGRDGVLRLTASGSRSQHQNREAAIERFQRLLADALKERAPRRSTRVPRAEKEARLRAKKRRAEVKKRRGPVRPED